MFHIHPRYGCRKVSTIQLGRYNDISIFYLIIFTLCLGVFLHLGRKKNISQMYKIEPIASGPTTKKSKKIHQ